MREGRKGYPAFLFFIPYPPTLIHQANWKRNPTEHFKSCEYKREKRKDKVKEDGKKSFDL